MLTLVSPHSQLFTGCVTTVSLITISQMKCKIIIQCCRNKGTHGLTLSKFRYLETREWARLIPIPWTEGRKSQPAKMHMPAEIKGGLVLGNNIEVFASTYNWLEFENISKNTDLRSFLSEGKTNQLFILCISWKSNTQALTQRGHEKEIPKVDREMQELRRKRESGHYE